MKLFLALTLLKLMQINCNKNVFHNESPIESVVASLYEDEMNNAKQHIEADLGTDESAIYDMEEKVKGLRKQAIYAIFRCDYEYIPTRGDPGEPTSLTLDGDPEPVILKVEGWTFEAAQRGIAGDGTYPASEFRLIKADGSVDAYWTKNWEAYENRSGYTQVTEKCKGDKYTEGYFDEEDYTKGLVYRYEPDVIEQKMKESVEIVDEEDVCGITADVGFSQAFQESVMKMTSTPVILSALQQLSLVSKMIDLGTQENPSGKKILVMTANGETFDENLLIPKDVPLASLEIIGLETTLFGRWVAEGRSFSRLKKDAFDEASVEEAIESVLETTELYKKKVEDEGCEVVAIVQECAELPAYSNAVRVQFGIPVYDTMTAIEFARMGSDFGGYSAYMM